MRGQLSPAASKLKTRGAQPRLRHGGVVEVGLVGFWANLPLLSKTVTVIVWTVSRVRGKQVKNPTIPTPDNFFPHEDKTPLSPTFRPGDQLTRWDSRLPGQCI